MISFPQGENMASLEGDVMRSFALVLEVIKDQVMADVQSAAVKNKVLTGDMDASANLKTLDPIIRAAVDQAGRNAMRQMQSSLKPYARQMEQHRLDASRR